MLSVIICVVFIWGCLGGFEGAPSAEGARETEGGKGLLHTRAPAAHVCPGGLSGQLCRRGGKGVFEVGKETGTQWLVPFRSFPCLKATGRLP